MFDLRLCPCILLVLLVSTYGENAAKNETKIEIPNVKNVTTVAPSDVQILEGGKVSITSTTEKTTTEMNRLYGREQITNAPTTINNTSSTIKETIDVVNATSTVANKTSVSTTTEKVIPVSEKIDAPTNITSHKKTVPKKGVNFTTEVQKNVTETKPLTKQSANVTLAASSTTTASTTTSTTSTTTTSTTTTTTTTTTERIRKPLFTIASDEEPFAPSNFVAGKGKNSSTLPKVESVKSYDSTKKSGPDYIVPIVAVILSVPLVAILLNAVYKRTKEWWYHRHYSRMDFLIDGMYNN